ncbi:uncharacterized protein EV422DRAFT_492441 [Fimicolochytrium jonesii]|uniref:uncharacterized protein n=1 Tax=Fimicolochytrium jonesii TaxID=1396493 RepID=UPI0022FE6420|nr:uncharacterized protein EV422DRAFT_492441 [Fimicolochytrium jonesii]KAI8825310.1 hypothetical protein EV422DRAFT_492441 [Fimicolochytrium jonesii]
MERINPADYPDTCSFPPASSHDGDHQQNPSTTPPPLIPKFVHFVRLHDTDASFGLLEYLVIRAAHVNIRPIRIFYHHRALPSTDNEWWERARGMITDLVYTDDFGAVFGNVVEKGAHKADVVRLRALMKWGGIYLDMDVIVTKPLDPLLHHPLVMGLEGHTAPYIGLCNAVILASPSSAFLHRWYAAYTTFNDAAWSDHSVVLPYNMSLTAPEGEICVLPPTSFFWPGYWPNHQAFVHLEDEWNFYNDYQYASHVYNTGKKYLWNLSVKGIRTRNSSFTRLVRPYLPDDV